MPRRPRHPDKDIEAALRIAENRGWRVEKRTGKGHCWGRIYCPHHDRSGCILSVWSTPANKTVHASHLIRQLEKCPHGAEENGDEQV